MVRIFLTIAFLTSLSFAAPQSDAGQFFGIAVGNAIGKLAPFILLTILVSGCLSFLNKKPEFALIGCGGTFALLMIAGLVLIVADFIKSHAVAILIIVVLIVLIGLVLYMVFGAENDGTDNAPPPKQEETSGIQSVRIDSVSPRPYIPVCGTDPTVAELTGLVGEGRVARSVFAACKDDGRYFKVMRNLYIPVHGGTTEIDLLLLHESGIYVFESKNLSGTVVGDMMHSKWVLYNGKQDHRYFVNPVRQNDGHVRALQDFLGLRERQFPFFSVVVFGEKTVLRSVPEDTHESVIVTSGNLLLKVESMMHNNQSCISQLRIEAMFNRLLCCENVSQQVKDAHKERITRKFGKIS